MTWNSLAPIANHLWQSTAAIGVAWLLTFLLRSNRAAIRYWVWLAASLKFLFPFAALTALGSRLHWRTEFYPAEPAILTMIGGIGQPFTAVGGTAALQHAPQEPLLPAILVALWLSVSLVTLIRWCVRWNPVAQNRQAAAADARVSETVERSGSRIEIRVCESLREPGVLGFFRPVLLWPAGMSDYLTNEHLDAIVAHELCHLRRRDNLWFAIHMFVQALFWFNPLVWWLGAKLIEERERACDEDVLHSGSAPEIYAGGVLQTCWHFLGQPAACVAGVTGSNPGRRIEEIMRNRKVPQVGIRGKVLLMAAGLTTIAGPVALGLLQAPASRAQSQQSLTFDVTSVRPSCQESRIAVNSWRSDRLAIENIPLNVLIQWAYRLRGFQVVGGPGWIASERFNIEGKRDGILSNDQVFPLLQSLLRDRFSLRVRTEVRQLPVYALLTARGGPKLAAARAGSCLDPSQPAPPAAPGETPAPPCGGFWPSPIGSSVRESPFRSCSSRWEMLWDGK